jgi:hypothetical protein
MGRGHAPGSRLLLDDTRAQIDCPSGQKDRRQTASLCGQDSGMSRSWRRDVIPSLENTLRR